MKRTSICLLATALLCNSVAICRRAGSALSQAPASAASLENPYRQSPAAKQAGEKLYRRHCASCHGKDANGGDRVPGLVSQAVKEAAPGALFWLLRNGDLRAGMPSWSQLPGQQRWQIVTYLKSLN